MKSLPHPPRRRAKAALASTFLALAVALTASRAPGETGISLDWRAPADCPGEAQIMANVERLLGSRAARPAEPIEVVATVSRDAGGFRVRIETKRAEAQVRELRGASCAAIANATALILAMMIDPSVASAAAAKAPPPDPPAPAPPEQAPAAPAALPAPAEAQVPRAPAGSLEPSAPAPVSPSGAPAPPPRASTPPPASTSTPARTAAPPPPQDARAPAAAPRLSFGLMAWSGIDVGTLPGPTAGFGVTGLSRYGAQQFELGAGLWLDRAATVPERPSAGGEIGLVAMAAGTCRSLLRGPVEIAPCLAIELGVMHARGFGVTSTQHASVFWAALRGGGAVTFRPTQALGLLVRIEGIAPITSPRFLLGGVGEVHTPTPGVRGALGVSYEL